MNNDRSRRTWNLALAVVAACIFAAAGSAGFGANDEDETIAFHLAELLRSARAVISQNQTVINDAALGDKGLTGEQVLADALIGYKERTGEDPAVMDPESREGHLLQAQMQAITEVMAENQDTINAPGVGFKGFIPAVFARLVNERFEQLAGDVAQIKVTAPEYLIRNRKARPDEWEAAVINDRFASPDWVKGDAFSEVTTVSDRTAFRLLVPEYYAASAWPATASRPARSTSPATRRKAATRATSARRSASRSSNDHREQRARHRARCRALPGRAGRRPCRFRSASRHCRPF